MPAKPGRKWSALRGNYAEVCELADVLRGIADVRGVTVRDLEKRMPYGHTVISEHLNGSRRPPWEFVTAFVDACANKDRQAKEILETKVRPLWEAAAPGRAKRITQVPAIPDATVPAALRSWVAALHGAARSQQVVARLQLSVSRHQDLVGNLIEMINGLNLAVEELTAERDALRSKVAEHGVLSEELARTGELLADTQARLDAAERLQLETSRRLAEALWQLEMAERLKSDAVMQAESARRGLAALEHHAVRLAGEAADEQFPEDYDVTALMGKADQGIAAEILRRVDDMLEQEAANLGDLHSAMSEPPRGSGGARGLSGGQPLGNARTGADNEERYQALVQSGNQVVWVTTPTGEMTEDSPEWRWITGQSVEEYLGHGWLDAVHPEDRERVERDWRNCVEAGKVFDNLYRVRTKTGSYRHYNVRAVPIERDGKIIEWIGASTDVTAQREAEDMRGRLTEQLSVAALRAARLQHATSMLAEALTVEQVVEVITEVGRSEIGADRSAIALLDPETLGVRSVNPGGLPDSPGFPGGDTPLDVPSVVTMAINTRRPIVAENADALRRQFKGAANIDLFLTHTDERAWIGMPLLAAGQVIGALRFTFTRPRKITDEERAFLEALAGQCALAVERASLFEREHKTAETLQRSLLPDWLPSVPGIILDARYRPVTRNLAIGGDWYDAFGLPDGRLAVAVGDVMGKGLSAAADMGGVRNALRALALTDPNPAAVLAGLDRFSTATGRYEQMATVVYLVINPETGNGLIGSAGHVPPLQLGRGTPSLLEMETGTPLGFASTRRQASYRLTPGNTVVLYSDGLVKNRRRGLDAGLDELVSAAAQAAPKVAEDPARLLAYLVDRMLTGNEQDDDVTVLVIHAAL